MREKSKNENIGEKNHKQGISKKSEQEIQELYLEAQIIQQQMQFIQEQLQKIEQQMAEVDYIIESLGDLKETKKGTEVLIPFSGGIFVRGEITENSKFILNVGSGVAVEKNLDDTKRLLREQKNNLTESRIKLGEQYNKFVERLEDIEKELGES